MLSHRETTDRDHPFRFRMLLLIGMGLFLGGIALGTVISPPSLQAQGSSPLTIQSSTSRVGVGTTTPAYTLDVAGTVNATAFRGDGSQITNLPAGQWTAAGTSMYYNGGNVGIGTTTPAGVFHVSGASANLFVVDSPNSRVGIKTNAPADTLHVVGGNVLVANNQFYKGTETGGSRINLIGVDAANKVRVVTGTSDVLLAVGGGKVGIGTTTPTSTLHVNGTLTATTKNFQIAHPLEPGKKLLVHSALEGPEAAVYYRGAARLENGEAAISLPPYFEALTLKTHRTIQLTPIDGWSPLYVVEGVQGGQFTVRTAREGNPLQRFYWEVKAVRADVPPLVVEKLNVAEQSKGAR